MLDYCLHFSSRNRCDVFAALAGNTSCRTFCFSGVSIKDPEVEVLAKALRRNKSLQQLSLHHSFIGDIGAGHLAEALKRNESLTHLRLSNTSIGDRGAALLADALLVNTTLQVLDLEYSCIGDVGAQKLRDAAAQNRVLTQILLGGNNIITLVLLGSNVWGPSARAKREVLDAVKTVPTMLESSNFGLAYEAAAPFETVDELCEGIGFIVQEVAPAMTVATPAHKGLALRLQQSIRSKALEEVRHAAGLAWTSNDNMRGVAFYQCIQHILREDEEGPLMMACARYCRSLNAYLVTHRDRQWQIASASGPVWAFENDAGLKVPFLVADGAILEEEHERADYFETSDLCFNEGHGTPYKFDFITMIQTNQHTGKTRRLYRLEAAEIDGAMPPNNVTLRGAWLPRRYVEFFMKGRVYRYAGYLASTDSHAVAMTFLQAAARPDPELVPVMFFFHFDPLRGCMHVNLLENLTECRGEREWLFQHYSAFSVRRPADLSKPFCAAMPVVIELDVFPDSKEVGADVPLVPWH